MPAVKDFEGRRVKEADKDIILRLKSDGRLFKQDTLVHSYPFCYRSGTPLIYRAVSSWFVAVEKIKTEIVTANKTTNWVPENLRDGRFGNWLEGARVSGELLFQSGETKKAKSFAWAHVKSSKNFQA
jgi:isoleucyl-tRNA synthetase